MLGGAHYDGTATSYAASCLFPQPGDHDLACMCICVSGGMVKVVKEDSEIEIHRDQHERLLQDVRHHLWSPGGLGVG